MLIPTLFKLGRYQEALARCLQGLRIEPDNTNFLYKAIYTAFRSGDLNEALRLWDASPTAFKSSTEVARLYAGILAARGYNEQAVDIARRYPARDTDGYLPYMLARSFAAFGDSSGARTLMQHALAIDSSNSTYMAYADSLAGLDR
jgi:tetratricopeptide (TPR) repeat protein